LLLPFNGANVHLDGLAVLVDGFRGALSAYSG
jgi:hypothetical protein